MPVITTSVGVAILELQQGKPVAIPTETVYGLAALIDQEKAIKTVFALKNRPLNHPLIVHTAIGWDLTTLVDPIPPYAKQLMDAFWPGPLTLVLQSRPHSINPLITGGQSSVAIRCPAHPMTQKILQKLGTPVVAPSANPFGKISPTTAQHVQQSFSNSHFTILDGGRCNVGIESTLVDATHPSHYQILRHGVLDETTLATVAPAIHNQKDSPLRTPGRLESHYKPCKNLYFFEQEANLSQFCQTRAGDVYVIANQCPPSIHDSHFYPLAQTPEKAAFELYYQLREADASSALCIAIKLPPATPAWLGIRERITKAGTAAEPLML